MTPKPVLQLGEGPDEKAMNMSVNACTDFFEYACGGWNKNTPIPDDQASWMRSFSVINEENEKMLRSVLEEYAAKPPAGEPYSRALGDYYASCMDEPGIEKAGTKVVTKEFGAINAVQNKKQLVALVARYHQRQLRPFFTFSYQQDFKKSTEVVGSAEQGGIGLPDRDYYLKDDARSKEIRAKYQEHVVNMLTLAGLVGKKATDAAASVMKIETELAKASMTKEEKRDPEKLYHRIERAGLRAKAPAVDWDAYMAAIGFPALEAINVLQPEFFARVSEIFASATGDKAAAGSSTAVSLAEIKHYLQWHYVRSQASRLPAKFVDEGFRFKQVLTGAKKNLPRWRRCYRAVDNAMGEALAQPFVKKTLGAEGKATTLAMIHAIESAMKTNLGTLAWMDGTTKEKAYEKLAMIANKIGYPDKWRNYDELAPSVSRASYLENEERAERFEFKRQMAKVGKPLDRSEWYMTPPSVNAYYDPSMNEMVFPAGILQPPFFANKASLAVNYGGIGMVMGHELTHGFDDEGRKFDGHGNMSEWWAPKVEAEFTKKATCVEKQYDGFVAIDDLHVNGKLTLGENIADLGGAKLSYAALMTILSQHKVETSSKFTPEQQYFLGFAQSWCGNYRPEMMRLLVNTNPHSPPKFRVNGPLANLPEFAKAFSCKQGDAMVRPPQARCEIW